jgi:hypothetical protein
MTSRHLLTCDRSSQKSLQYPDGFDVNTLQSGRSHLNCAFLVLGFMAFLLWGGLGKGDRSISAHAIAQASFLGKTLI